ncbi:MAG TPA: hypothetical protein VFF73_15030 [Planctomycetota bacterium]|nr:hypothetical protein [Planctomycetota bacterium]
MNPTKLTLALVLGAMSAALVGCIVARDGTGDLGGPGPSDDASKVPELSKGCISCHTGLETDSMHRSKKIGCVECHGGDASKSRPEGSSLAPPYDAAYRAAEKAAHVAPAFAGSEPLPPQSYTLLNREKTAFIRFINPGDLRVAKVTCGKCHPKEADNVPTSIMAHSAMVPGSGLYNNGALPYKRYLVGEFYMPNGDAANARAPRPATQAEKDRGVLDVLYAYPAFEASQTGNIFRVLERGNDANPRGLGTLAHVDAVFLTATKTRLNDPNLWLAGTNDYPGEYRSSGCSACHVPYANDDGPASGEFAKYGRDGKSASRDPTTPKESGHPILHAFTNKVPSSQCISCHIHQGSGALGNYIGIEWWDGETDGEQAYHADGSLKTGAELCELDKLANPKSKAAKFTGYHRSGWSFRKIFKRDEEGRLLDKENKPLLDAKGEPVDLSDPSWEQKAVHLVDAHFEKGMHCVDCHTHQDMHGDGKLYGAMIDAVEITCVDCHGTIAKRANLVTSNPAGGNDLRQTSVLSRVASDGTIEEVARPRPWFEVGKDGKTVLQRSRSDETRSWRVSQLVDVVDPASPSYNEKAARAKTLLKDGKHWGDPDASTAQLAHSSEQIHCYACHSSWTVSCAGCHLAQRVNAHTPFLHYLGEKTRNDVGYYSQGLRHDSFVLGITGTVQKNKIGPVRSASAVAATTEDGANGVVTHQQPTVSGAGYSGTAFSPFIPHTVDAKNAKACSACHVSDEDDNNSRLATLFGLGAHGTDFVGQYAWLALGDGGITAVKVTEGWEPQPVIGSDFHRILHPDSFAKLEARGRLLDEQYGHRSSDARSVQLRGEYLYLADGPGGLRVYDVANIDNKNVAQRIVSAPFSPLGHDAHVPTRNATAVLLASSVPLDPLRNQDPTNLERHVHPLFGYAFVTDAEEGLVVVDVNSLIDGDPENNFLTRAATYDANGKLKGARGGAFVGRYLYVVTDHSIAVVDVNDPKAPVLVTEVTQGINQPRALDVEFRYAALCDAEGMKVLDVTKPEAPELVKNALVPLGDARGVRVMRTYAYVAAGKDGLAVVDVKKFREPHLVEKFDAGGDLNDATAVTTGLTNASFFAYVADGKNGLRIVELVTPSRNPQADGYSPRPKPRLIATCRTGGRAVAVSGGAQRDRAVDESGNQLSVFGRLGSRPLDLEERRRFYMRDGQLFTVRDDGVGLERVVSEGGRLRREIAELLAQKERLEKEQESATATGKKRLAREIKEIEDRIAVAQAKLAGQPVPVQPPPEKPPEKPPEDPARAAAIAAAEKELQDAKDARENLPLGAPASRKRAADEKIAALEAKLAALKKAP